MILEKTVEEVKQIYINHEIEPPEVSKVVLGLGYTGVEVSTYENDSILGLAATVPNIVNNTNCSKIDFAGNLTNKALFELMEWSFEPPSVRKIVGLATLNAVSQHILKIKNTYTKLKGDLINHLHIDKDSSITVIGLMKPLIRKISKVTKSIILVEDSIPNSAEFTEFKFRKGIEQMMNKEFSTDILICTGTVLINNTIEKILGLFRDKARKIIIIGPSASIIPDILFENGVDIVGGMTIVDPEATLRVLQEGGGTKLFKQYGKKYNLIKK
ncbi:MAG: Rossmann-like domain-containing protein [Promethearchaeota archaeon]|jgi:uncharacterized protein (DUF4213/DUF364 family)